MSESVLFDPFILFFSILISSLAWHILRKGSGTFDNLWIFCFSLSLVFILSSTLYAYFPFSHLSFFLATLSFLNFATLYIYSFPKSILPNFIWSLLVLTADLLSLVIFFNLTKNLYLIYIIAPLFFIALNVAMIVRKIKYLKSETLKNVLFRLSFISFLSFFLPLFALIASIAYDSSYYVAALMAALPISLILLAISIRLNDCSFSGINRTNFWLTIIFALPTTALIKGLATLKFFMFELFGTLYFSFIAASVSFLIFLLSGLLISLCVSLTEGFIDKNRNDNQTCLNDFRIEIEDVADSLLLIQKFSAHIKKWFPKITNLASLGTDEIFPDSDLIETKLIENVDDYPFLKNRALFLHKTYFTKNSAFVFQELFEFINKFGGDVYIPIFYKSEIPAFLIISASKISHNAIICVQNMTLITLNKLEKISLLRTIIETEKKVETFKHFQETGKMLSFIAHELRSPLSSIMFNIEVVKDSLLCKKEVDLEYLDISLKELRRLNETIEKMLNYGRDVKLSPFAYDFRSFFSDIRQFFNYEEQVIEFIDKTGGKQFKFDWDILKNVFINLITNSLQAIKRGEKAGKIGVSAVQKRKKLLIEVSDNGPGIPEKDKNAIFEPFYTTRKEGNGLGLATCQKIVKLSGGSIVLKETSAAGTTFLITFPLE